jgi:hypothetical protein
MLGRVSREVTTSWKLRCRGMTVAVRCDKEEIPTHYASLSLQWNASRSTLSTNIARPPSTATRESSVRRLVSWRLSAARASGKKGLQSQARTESWHPA